MSVVAFEPALRSPATAESPRVGGRGFGDVSALTGFAAGRAHGDRRGTASTASPLAVTQRSGRARPLDRAVRLAEPTCDRVLRTTGSARPETVTGQAESSDPSTSERSGSWDGGARQRSGDCRCLARGGADDSVRRLLLHHRGRHRESAWGADSAMGLRTWISPVAAMRAGGRSTTGTRGRRSRRRPPGRRCARLHSFLPSPVSASSRTRGPGAPGSSRMRARGFWPTGHGDVREPSLASVANTNAGTSAGQGRHPRVLLRRMGELRATVAHRAG